MSLRFNIQVATAVTGEEFYFEKQKPEVVGIITQIDTNGAAFH